MTAWTISQGFGASPRTGVDLGGMTASVAAHALVLGLLAISWSDEVLVEGGTRAALVTIDLAAPEGGPGAKLQSIDLHDDTPPIPTPTPPKPTIPTPAITVQKTLAAPEPAPLPPLLAQAAGGGGDGRSGQGTGAAPTHQDGTAKVIPVRATTSHPPLIAASLQPRTATGSQAEADARGTGGSGGGRSDQAGNSAVSNFKGRVYQHLLRYRRTNTIGSGKVLVGFTIEPDGDAQGIFVARTSGVSRFDHEALQLVRRSAPFPRPPDGEAHSFTFEIAGQ